MFEEFMHTTVDVVASGIEFLAVILIGLVFIYALIGSIANIGRQNITYYQKYKVMIARVLQTGLEFLVAADIIRTVIVKPTLNEVFILALLIIVRTFLSWTLTVETEGVWPWQKKGGEFEKAESSNSKSE